MRTILITGASTGIGRCATEMLSARGERVFACARTPEQVASLSTLPGVTGLCVDVTQPEHIKQALSDVQSHVQQLDALVNNAGISVSGPLIELEEEALKQQMDVNVWGAFRMVKAFFPLLHAAQGRVINISSMAARIVTPFLGPYGMSKMALEGFSDALRREIEPLGMPVVVIQPGPTRTAIWQKTDVERTIDEDSPFAQRARHIGRQMIARAERNALPVERVVNVLLHALTQKRPKTRYVVTPEKWPQLILSKMPDRWVDWILQKTFG